MADLKRTVEVIFEGTDASASRKASDVLAKVRELDESQRTAASGAAQLAGGLDNIGSKAAGVSLLNNALASLASGLVFKAFVDANVEVQKFENGIKAVKGASTDTRAELDYIKGAAEKYGIELGVLARTYTSLTAATVGTRLEGAATRQVFDAVTVAMAAAGKSGADTERALKAIEQIAGKGKVSMEELRGQLGDALPGALQIAARALGTTTANLDDLVKKGISAEDFLPKFAAELNKTFAGATFDGYEQQMGRLRNAISSLFVEVGKSGAFDALTAGVNFGAREVQAFGIDLQTVRGYYDAVARSIRNGDFSTLAGDFTKAAQSSRQLYAALETGNESLAETNRLRTISAELSKAASDAAASEFANETNKFLRQQESAQASVRAATELDALLKRLGVDPKKFKDGLDEVARDLVELSKNPAVTGETFLAAFEATLKRVRSQDDINLIGKTLTEAFTNGRISADALKVASNDLAKAQDRVKTSSGESSKKLEDQAKALERAKEKAEQFKLEMEKLASNERIKNIEAKVQLDIADIQAQTERVKAILSSIDNTVNSTGSLLKDLFGDLGKGVLDPSARRLVEQQIETENKRRQDALDIQRKISQAQIDYLNAQTKAIARGDSVIKVDGAGLQPHLEAFMWEILRTIQIRTNADGLQMLLGV